MTDDDIVYMLERRVPQAVSGDRTALGDVIALVRPKLKRYCAARSVSLDVAADDVVQDVCLALVTAIPKYRDMGKPFMAFVYGIAAHKLADAGRKASLRRSYSLELVIEEPSTDESPEKAAIDGEFRSHAQALMETLPPRHRKIILMRVVWGMTAPETGRALGMSAGAVRVAQHRAMNQLRAELSKFALLSA
ncbi:RNA polymerase sigma factor ShbA [Rhodococcus sp. G-MC3]|uniref:RNA polymerase sigma factor ShbA n=1 Tax=Rhodococcus sp. G-MC3 TaxID=3046209 RepID=UPI0024B8C1D1|nr:RNA polymerase sigma factor ShbA [Rhodococcus sp. G-MC3]MDJ0393868.1 RNA polymerase sigma factor ShbA [Rhodococcus sp. G-MC3]